MMKFRRGTHPSCWVSLQAMQTPPVDPLDHHGICNGTRAGDEVCDPVGGSTMLPTLAGCAPYTLCVTLADQIPWAAHTITQAPSWSVFFRAYHDEIPSRYTSISHCNLCAKTFQTPQRRTRGLKEKIYNTYRGKDEEGKRSHAQPHAYMPITHLILQDVQIYIQTFRSNTRHNNPANTRTYKPTNTQPCIPTLPTLHTIARCGRVLPMTEFCALRVLLADLLDFHFV